MNFRIFPLSRTNFSVPFRPPLKQQCGAKWICNLFKQLSLPFWESTFYPPPPSLLPPANVTVKCTNVPNTNKCWSNLL